MRSNILTSCVAVVAALASTGCYAYQPVLGASRSPSDVRFRLTTEGATELARYLGPNVSMITGRLAAVQPNGSLSVAPVWVKSTNGVELPWNGEGTVTVPREYFTQLEQRTYNGRRTTFASATVTAGLVAIAVAALKTGGAHGNSAPLPGTPAR